MIRKCPECNGTGQDPLRRKKGPFDFSRDFPCDECRGEGYIIIPLYFMEWWAKIFVVFVICSLIYKGVHFITYDLFHQSFSLLSKELTFKGIFLWNLSIGAILSLFITIRLLAEEKIQM